MAEPETSVNELIGSVIRAGSAELARKHPA